MATSTHPVPFTRPASAPWYVWAGVVARADEVGGHYCEDCHVAQLLNADQELTMASGGVRPYALDPARAQALWAKSEELVGEKF